MAITMMIVTDEDSSNVVATNPVATPAMRFEVKRALTRRMRSLFRSPSPFAS
jgi:hypothetical protein